MLKVIKKIIKNKLYARKSGREIDIKDDDVLIVSYPKSGNTWMRFLIGNILYESFNFSNMEELIPDIYVVNNSRIKSLDSPRIMKSHEYYDPRYQKIIYVIRDPRSVAVSYFFYLKKFRRIAEDESFKVFLPRFIKGSYDSFGPWDKHVKSWVCTKNNNNLMLIKYEDLKDNPQFELSKISRFLGLEFSERVISNSIEKSTFSNMKKNELQNLNSCEVLSKSDSSIAFVRAGKVDEWKEYFGSDELQLLIEAYGETMKEYGYL